ncbi:hypothetical protein AgCh_023786 [Apium graveolens]
MEPRNFQERMSKLAQAHKQKEKQRLNLRIIQLQKKLKVKQRLELEIEQMSSGVEDLRPIFEGGGGDVDAEAKKQIESLKEILKRKDKHIEDLEELNVALIIKEKKINDELEHARQLLIDIEKEIMEPINFQESITKLTEAKKIKPEDKQHFEGGGKNVDTKKKLESLKKNLKEKDELIESLEELNQALIVKEKKMNDEFQYARKVLIDCLKDMPNSKASIGIKIMGDIDCDQILAAAKKRYPAEEAKEKATEWTNLLLDKLKDPDWYPFKILMEVIDEEDDFIKAKKKEWGAEVYDIVVTMLTEMNEYNPCWRCPVPELWNFAQGRKATLDECAEFLRRFSKSKKRKESC